MCNGNCNQGRRCDCGRPSNVAAWILIPALILVLLSGCTTINMHRPPPSDWPKLEVSVKKVGFWELQKICGGSYLMGVVTQYFGCAWIYFDTMKCDVYYAADDDSGLAVIEHEMMHCDGYDHVGSSTLADGWTEWKRGNGK